jgi:hypothetical protein
MSSFPLSLSSLSNNAKERLARLDSFGGALRARLLSPVPEVASGPGLPGSPSRLSGSSAATLPAGGSLGLGFGVPAGSEVGVSGEFLLSGGVSGGLTAFVVTPELLDTLCCGAVAGGVKSVLWAQDLAVSLRISARRKSFLVTSMFRLGATAPSPSIMFLRRLSPRISYPLSSKNSIRRKSGLGCCWG